MIVLFTDFGVGDPYVGQMHAVFALQAPGIPVIDLFHGVPNYDIRAGGYLLPAYAGEFPPGTVFVCVVDPGVGWLRRPVIVDADGCWYVGPDNGLFEIVVRRARRHECRVIRWRPTHLSESFHGRDLFAPVAARLACSEKVESEHTALAPLPPENWPDDLPHVVYIDHYGNAITGLRAQALAHHRILRINGHRFAYARIFAEVQPGSSFWYENANGLVEIAMNQRNAAQQLGISLGDEVIVAD